MGMRAFAVDSLDSKGSFFVVAVTEFENVQVAC